MGHLDRRSTPSQPAVPGTKDFKLRAMKTQLKSKAVSISDVMACPKRSFDQEHYRRDGSCKCLKVYPSKTTTQKEQP